jgi:sarcosine oxidase subunit alpha
MRLPLPWGSRLDRADVRHFEFDGRRYRGFAGDTVASALAANGVRVLSRSFKYHRPRGILTMAGLDANTLVQVGDVPNVRADLLAVENGLVVRPQNVFGSLQRDWGRALDYGGGWLPVGFYYKAFYRPKGAWRFWEPLVRRFAGLGKVVPGAPRRHGGKLHLHADVAVIGGGAAGLSAAIAAAEAGAEVALIETQPALGGALEYARFSAAREQEDAERRRLLDAVRAQPLVRVLTATTCTGWFADHWLTLVRDSEFIKLRARAVVLASGTLDQPAVFRNNDLPGVMFGSAAQRLLRLYAVRPGHRAVVLAASDEGYGVALDLLEAGVEVAGVVDPRAGADHGELAREVRARGVPIREGLTVRAAFAARGGLVLGGVLIGPPGAEAGAAGAVEALGCDLLCVSVGASPAAQLASQAGARLRFDADGLPRIEPPAGPAVLAGSVGGVCDLQGALEDGHRAGLRAARFGGYGADAAPPAAGVPSERAAPRNCTLTISADRRGRDFIDFDEDLQVGDIEQAVAEGYDDLELAKRYSTAVMGPSQGRQSAVNHARVAAAAAGRPLANQPPTTQRPPFWPEPFAVLAGGVRDPLRRTAMHHRHLELGAQMTTAGAWLRPAWYGPPEARERCVTEEALLVRNGVALIDVSTLGKLELRGPDAAELLNRCCTSDHARQGLNRIRYLLMTDGTGAVTDDGVACRLAGDQFYLTATTTGVDAAYRAMLRWNAQWRLDVTLGNLTSAFAAVNLAGPRSRAVLGRVAEGLDLSAAGFPYLGYRAGAVAGIPARLLRVGFVGELAYEIHVPADQGEALWDALLAAGRDEGIRPFGVEAQRLLRLEKGHLIVGQDTDALTVPQHAALEWAVAADKPFFVGQRAIRAIAARGIDRRLVGFRIERGAGMPQECNLVIRAGAIAGRVTSVADSPTLGGVIGLAYVAPDQTAPGSAFTIKLGDGRLIEARVAAPPFYDPDNARQAM